jgi:hypothetical protein
MKRHALLASGLPLSALVSAFLLSGCSGSGFWQYERDTLTLPGANPNMPVGSSENYLRSRNGTLTEPPPLLTETGDIWPGPTQNVPTLKDLQKQQSAETGANGAEPGAGLAPLPPLPSLPGYEISQQDVVSPQPTQAFPQAVVPTQNGRMRIEGDQGYKSPGGGSSTVPGGNIVVPNGNGTSTVISPTGQVSTIPTPK